MAVDEANAEIPHYQTMSAKEAIALLGRARDTLARLSPYSPAVQSVMLDLAELIEAIQTNHGAEDDSPI